MQRAFWATLLMLLAAFALCKAQYHEGLPHRQSWELYSIQGVYSQQSCPGQHPEWVEIDDQRMFLGCFGDTTND